MIFFVDWYRNQRNKLHNTTLHNQIFRTESISYPRSGHGTLHNTLKYYFGQRLNYCAGMPEANCGCTSVPCTNPETNFSKNHDFDVCKGRGIGIRSEQRYLIQYRNPVRSIVSNYYLYLSSRSNEDSLKQWYFFAQAGIVYWNRFIDKWLLDSQSKADKLMACPYEKLVENPTRSINDVIKFMTNDDANPKYLRKAIKKVNIRPLNRYFNFHHFDPGFFREIEAGVSPRLELLGIPSFEDSI